MKNTRFIGLAILCIFNPATFHFATTAEVTSVPIMQVELPVHPSTPQTATTSQSTAPSYTNASITSVVTPSPPKAKASTPVIQNVQTTATPIKTTADQNPNRPYYDQWGNEFDYMGNLMNRATTCANDPISDQPNPYCSTPPTVNGIIIHPSADPTAMQSPFSCTDGAAQLKSYEDLFAAKPNLAQTENWTRYQELQVAYSQNCK